MKAYKKITIPVLMLLISSVILYTFSCKGESGPDFLSGTRPDINNSEAITDASNVQKAFNEIYDLYENTVVFISTEQTIKMRQHPFFNDPFFREFFGGRPMPEEQEQKRTGLGTGFILSDDGYIATNHHVVANVDKVEVRIGEKTYQAKIIGSDEATDLALLKISSLEKFKPAFLGDSDKVRVGDWAIAIGNPFGLDRTFTTGVISAVGRNDLDRSGRSSSHLQTDASINPGNSGGPLINIDGQVIGINRMIYSKSGGNMGIGFAIPINTARDILRQIREKGKVSRPFIGVQIARLTEDYAKKAGLDEPKGALVAEVVKASPAEKGGIRQGDIIVAVNDKKVENFPDLINAVESFSVGTKLNVTVIREKKRIKVSLIATERP
ncbi:MAG: trypsin-like peptidase domain-containing protein [Spirochaetes bacterium]|nr:trypsin-like peptidase domain-containing protein [Spirochaetota bacterium]MBN2770422.1 trypsin-like peptidase domain-containing protein [Spirochaetota bacterium]